MHSLKIFQRLPRCLRRHKLLRALAFVNGGGTVQAVRINNDFDAYIDIRDGFARLVPIENEFEPSFFELADRLLPVEAPVFVDVGANYGLMSIGLWHRRLGKLRVRLYEPNPHLCAIIRRSLLLNKAEAIELVEAAAMDRPGALQLHFELSHTGGGFVDSGADGLPIEAVSLDQDLDSAGISHVDLIKIDVEGNEGKVLSGLRCYLERQAVGAIYFEYCPGHIERTQTGLDPIPVLLDHGFEIFACSRHAIDVLGGATHRLANVESGSDSPIQLRALDSPPELHSTDLLAMPPGRAIPL